MDQPRQSSTASQPPETPPQPSDSASKPATLTQIQPPPSTNPSPSSVVSSIPSSPAPQSPSLNPNPNPPQYARPVTSPVTQQQQHLSQPLVRPPPQAYSRPWQQHSSYTHFSSASSPLLSSSSAPASSSSSLPITGQQRGGMAIGMSEATSNSSAPQVRMMQGTQGIGMMGTLGSGSQMRPSGMAQHQQRPTQSSLRPASSPSTQSPVAQNFQGHSLMRPSPIGSPSVQSTGASQQSLQAINQPWLSSTPQGKPPLPPPSYRPQVNSPSMQQRPHIPQQHLSTSAATSQPQQLQSQQQHQPQEQLQQLRSPQQPLPHPHQPTRVQGLVNQKVTSPVMPSQPPVAQPGNHAKTVSAENETSDDRILGKRSIHELLQQIDPSEKLDPEVEDILADIAEDFVESITTFGCSLAKHRKSDTLEAKDILLHVERNWNIRPPGFSSDEFKTFRKPLTTDIHKERLAVIKKSVTATEAASARNQFGHGTANARGGQSKTPSNPLGSTTFNH
ncbi:transcription initiation factor TFIID subunit 12 isoform X2 [Arabidopsis lyrata subsp. lyrata]|uniref:transcription initiation factor TFIID subunit 12 isoform X2 n=1 Tax=Arabidopsis lyrata subsp. lyrata TaxID=81972 RepID=UPI000A29C000|nr:transcription initiation factor TFIID subunit 12 isoform X2 [Arabidopsis lyrata subsp. lyrata]|eukprot:XP_020886401.1 transcription initiation factor TFIID subunit 12 isoform X2 [Arabidopsis lyrata subsp. lyrata]